MATLNKPLIVERVPQVYQKAVEMTTPARHTTAGRCPLDLAGLDRYGRVKVVVLLSRLVSGNAPFASSGFTVKVSVPPGIQR